MNHRLDQASLNLSPRYLYPSLNRRSASWFKDLTLFRSCFVVPPLSLSFSLSTFLSSFPSLRSAFSPFLFASSSAFFLPFPSSSSAHPSFSSTLPRIHRSTFLLLLLLFHLLLPKPSPSSLSLRVYSTGEAFLLIFLLLFLVWLDVARLVVAPSPLSLSLEARERSENGETGETFSLSKLAATDSPLAGNGETVHHVRLKSVTTLHSLMPGLHDQLHFQRGPANYRYDCFRPRGPPDK